MILSDDIKKNISIDSLKKGFGLVGCPIVMAVGIIGFYKSMAMLSGLALDAKDDIDPVKSVAYFLGGIALITVGSIGYGHEMLKPPSPTEIKPPDIDGPS